MNNIKDFYVLRYSIVKEEPTLIETKNLPELKGDTILSTLLSGYSWETRGVSYAFIGFSKEVIDDSIFYVGKIAKLKKAQLGVKTSEDIVEQEIDDWKAVILIVDTKNQFIFARKTSLFGDVSQICNSIQIGINKVVIPEYNYKVFVEPVPSKGKFWEIVDNSAKIYRLELMMISPNIMETDKTARAALENMKNLFNQEKTIIKMENSAGELIIPYEPIDGYVNYIEEGEGKWELVTDDHKTKKKKKYNSDGTPEILEVDTEELEKNNLEIMDTKQLELYELSISRTNKFLLNIKDYIKGKVRTL
ncbi:hypothetical protein [Psychrobacter urativorans]|uniref:Uncharacterized protein n=1 Tax=Psychrobacter urativorans TaxID=45610 RepID=A0A0M3V8R5_9GAMM|nr:hypothetical protein [Psychrobacter urativorans]ALF59643.1 hypothetical protein AOC03_05920 [Psychrobacter urativorans]